MSRENGELWPRVVAFENLHLAYRRAARGKRSRPAVAAFEFDLERNLIELQAELRAGAYVPGGYRSFHIHAPKRRLISAAPFRDRVMHHALVNVIEPIFERRFIGDSFANRRGKGTHRALDRATGYLRRYAYVLPLDVRQFFPSIDHHILLTILGRTIADRRVLDLVGAILASGAGVQRDEYDMVFFPGDDLWAASRPRGLPIGNLTSQFWANVYLDRIDQYVKRRLRCPGYVRYVDDMLVFADDKETLHAARAAIEARAAELRLTLHQGSAQPRPSRCGVPFLGFHVFPTHRRLKRRNVVAARRRLSALARAYGLGVVDETRVTASIRGWVNHARYGDTHGLRTAVLGGVRFVREPHAHCRPVAHLQQDL